MSQAAIFRQLSAQVRQACTHSSMSPTRAQLSAQALQNSVQARHAAGCCGDWFSITAAAVRQLRQSGASVGKGDGIGETTWVD